MELANSTASIFPAALKPFLIILRCFQRYSNTSKIHCEYSDLRSGRANDTLTSAGYIPLTNCFLTSLAKQALYLLAINDFDRFIDCYVKGLKVVCEVVWNDSNITKNFITQTHDYFVFLSF